MIRKIHLDYLNSGANVITTAAFRTNREAVRTTCSPDENVVAKARQLTQLAVSLANEAVAAYKRAHPKEKRAIEIAGNLTALNDTYMPELAPNTKVCREEHREKIKHLVEGKRIQIVLGETLNTVREAVGFLQAAQDVLSGMRNSGIRVWVSFVCKDQGQILDGTPFNEVIDHIARYKPEAILVNCCYWDKVLAALHLANQARAKNFLLGGYSNAEIPFPKAGEAWFRPHWLTTDVFRKNIHSWLKHGVSIIGGCCGTRPRDIRTLKDLITANS